MRPTMIRSFVVSLLLISMLIATPVIACWLCKRSPDGKYGFCRPDYDWGYNDCSEYVYNSFNGTTTCNLEGSNCPYSPYPGTDPGTGGGGGGGDTGSDCWWPGLTGGCLLYY